MRILRWALVVGAALLVGLGFAVLSESLVLAVIPVASILVLAGYLSLERRLGSPRPRRKRRRTGSIGSGATYAGSTDGGTSVGGDCGFDGGGGFGGDGGGGGGC